MLYLDRIRFKNNKVKLLLHTLKVNELATPYQSLILENYDFLTSQRTKIDKEFNIKVYKSYKENKWLITYLFAMNLGFFLCFFGLIYSPELFNFNQLIILVPGLMVYYIMTSLIVFGVKIDFKNKNISDIKLFSKGRRYRFNSFTRVRIYGSTLHFYDPNNDMLINGKGFELKKFTPFEIKIWEFILNSAFEKVNSEQ